MGLGQIRLRQISKASFASLLWPMHGASSLSRSSYLNRNSGPSRRSGLPSLSPRGSSSGRAIRGVSIPLTWKYGYFVRSSTTKDRYLTKLLHRPSSFASFWKHWLTVLPKEMMNKCVFIFDGTQTTATKSKLKDGSIVRGGLGVEHVECLATNRNQTLDLRGEESNTSFRKLGVVSFHQSRNMLVDL